LIKKICFFALIELWIMIKRCVIELEILIIELIIELRRRIVVELSLLVIELIIIWLLLGLIFSSQTKLSLVIILLKERLFVLKLWLSRHVLFHKTII